MFVILKCKSILSTLSLYFDKISKFSCQFSCRLSILWRKKKNWDITSDYLSAEPEKCQNGRNCPKMAKNGWKWLEMDGNGWKWQKNAIMAKTAKTKKIAKNGKKWLKRTPNLNDPESWWPQILTTSNLNAPESQRPRVSTTPSLDNP